MKINLNKSLLAMMLIGVSSFNVNAAEPRFCDLYSLEAIYQYQQAKDLGITNENPSIWADNYQYHNNWCLRVPEGTATAGKNDRQSRIDHKLTTISSDLVPSFMDGLAQDERFCTDYANAMVKQYSQAVKFNLTGLNSVEGWHADFQKHKLWCKTSPRELCLSIVDRHQDYLAKHGGVPIKLPSNTWLGPQRR